MAKYGYIMQSYDPKTQAKAVSLSMPISTKKTVEMCLRIRGKELAKAQAYLRRVIALEQPVAYTRHNSGGAGHKPGMAVGRYPVKTAQFVLKLLEQVEANAENKGLNPKSLAITHIAAQFAGKSWHYGRQRRRRMKRTTVEVVVAEREAKKPYTKKEKKQ